MNLRLEFPEPAPAPFFERLSSYPWFVVGTVCIGAFIGRVDASIVQLAMPTFEDAFDAPLHAVSWVAVGYVLAFAAALPVFARLAEIGGPKALYLAGFAWRGQPGRPDEPQHAVMGVITHDLLTLLGLEHAPFPETAADLAATMALASGHLRIRELPFALVMAAGSVTDEELNAAPPIPPVKGRRYDDLASGPLPTRLSVLERFLAATDDETAVIATAGKCGRELFTLSDRRQHLYQVGSMGGASAMALGVALNTSRKVVVFDRDGAALMKLGNLATIGAYRPDNLLHVVLDNGVHDSTGGQATVSSSVDFTAVALACGYRYAALCRGLSGFDAALGEAGPGPALIHVRIQPGSLAKLGRPTVGPDEVARRFRSFLAEEPAR